MVGLVRGGNGLRRWCVFETTVELIGGLPADPEPDVAVNQSTDAPEYGGGATIVYVDQGVGLYASTLIDLESYNPSSSSFPTPGTEAYATTDSLAQPVVAVVEDGGSAIAWVQNGEVQEDLLGFDNSSSPAPPRRS